MTAKARVNWRRVKELRAVLCEQKLSVEMKRKLCITSIRTAMVYGDETWAFRIKEDGVFVRVVVMLIYGVKLRNSNRICVLMSRLGLSECVRWSYGGTAIFLCMADSIINVVYEDGSRNCNTSCINGYGFC